MSQFFKTYKAAPVAMASTCKTMIVEALGTDTQEGRRMKIQLISSGRCIILSCNINPDRISKLGR